MKKARFLILGLVFLAMTMACSQKSDKLVVALDTTFPPMEFMNDQKEIVGFDIDMINAISEVSGLQFEFRSVSWDGIFAGVQNGTYDLIASSVTITDERKANMDFSTPYVNAGQAVVVLAENNTDTGIGDFAGRKVGAQVNTTGSIEVEKIPDVTMLAYDDIALCFEDLVNNRVEAVVIDTPVAASYLKNPKFAGKIKIIGEPITAEYYGIVVRKGNTELLQKINAALATLEADGKLAEIKAKWLK